MEIAGRESTTSWRELLLSLKQRGLSGVRLAISDDHAGLKRALAEVLPEARQHLAAWLERWAAKYHRLTTWVEEGIEETFTFYRLPQLIAGRIVPVDSKRRMPEQQAFSSHD